MSTSDLGPIALVGRFVRLDPLRANRAAALWEVARGMDWGSMLGSLRSREDVDRRIAERLSGEERKAEYAFAVFLKPRTEWSAAHPISMSLPSARSLR